MLTLLNIVIEPNSIGLGLGLCPSSKVFGIYPTCSTFLYLQAHSKKLTSQIQSVVDELETHVDPFDLDVFAPYIRDHLARQTQRANVS